MQLRGDNNNIDLRQLVMITVSLAVHGLHMNFGPHKTVLWNNACNMYVNHYNYYSHNTITSRAINPVSL